MRKLYSEFLDKEEANTLVNIVNSSIFPLHSKYNQSDPNKEVIDKILNKLKEDFDFKVKHFSYYKVESKNDGHQWHVDTGSKGHMKWCDLGVSLLLQKGDTGGETYYADDDKETNKIKIEREVCDLVAHTSNEWHMVTPHTGKRIVLLMFI